MLIRHRGFRCAAPACRWRRRGCPRSADNLMSDAGAGALAARARAFRAVARLSFGVLADARL